MKHHILNTFKNILNGVRRYILPACLIVLISACGGTKGSGDSSEYNELAQLIHSREFQIENDWANPLRGSMINLIGNPNIIRFKGDSVEVYLPYFGVRQSGGGYGTEGGVKFEGLVRNLSIEEEKGKNRLHVKFEGKQDTEDLDFRITLYANGNANTSVNSSQRDAISYRGKVEGLPEEGK